MATFFRPSKGQTQAGFSFIEKTPQRVWLYSYGMAKPMHDWYLQEWLDTLGKKQADIVRDLEWNPARISLMLRGKQQYNRDAVNELATYLHLRPYELLMHPDDAMGLRQLRADAVRIAASSEPPPDEAEERRVSKI